MRILVCNDDGINAPGIDVLARSFQKYGEVIVFAPASEQSAKSHSMTFFSGVKAEKVEGRPYEAYKVYGTPGDCTRLGLSLYKDIDLVVTGINDGFNIGNDIPYSGTVAAAIEANLHGVKSFAFSTHRGNVLKTEEQMDYAIKKTFEVANHLDGVYLLNVNFPFDLDNIKGALITRMGTFDDITDVELTEDGYRYTAYNLSYDMNDLTIDYVAEENGYLSITPLSFDYTNKIHFDPPLNLYIYYIIFFTFSMFF